MASFLPQCCSVSITLFYTLYTEYLIEDFCSINSHRVFFFFNCTEAEPLYSRLDTSAVDRDTFRQRTRSRIAS